MAPVITTMTNTTATTKGCRRTPSRILNGTSLSSMGSNPAPIHREKPGMMPLGVAREHAREREQSCADQFTVELSKVPNHGLLGVAGAQSRADLLQPSCELGLKERESRSLSE